MGTLQYSFENDEITVIATVDSDAEFVLEDGTKVDINEMTLTADKIEEGTEEYENYVKAVKDEFTVDEGKSLQFTPYDVYFLYDGNKIEPEDDIRIVKRKK